MKMEAVVAAMVIVSLWTLHSAQGINAKEDVEWGKACTSATNVVLTFGTERGDNLTINVSCTEGWGFWFRTDLLFLNSSNESLAINGGGYFTSMSLWIVSAGGGASHVWLSLDPSTPSINYTLNISRVKDQEQRTIEHLRETISDLTAQLENLTINVTNVTVLNITNITVVNQTVADLTYLENNVTLLFDQIQNLQNALLNISPENITIYNNTTITQWEGINATLDNISYIHERLSRIENITNPIIPPPYNDTEIRQRIQHLEARNATNTTNFINRTVMAEKIDVLPGVILGAIAGAGTGAAICYAFRRPQNKPHSPKPVEVE